MVSALFVRSDSIYKSMGLDCWDIDRDARNWPGGNPIIAHPPCRAWGKLKHFAKPRHDEKDLALFSIAMIRKYGGVLEHPHGSTLWKELFMPLPGYYDAFGGFTIELNQFVFGHKAEKKTWVYIYGITPDRLPSIPQQIGKPLFVVNSSKYRSGNTGYLPNITKKEREATPPAFAKWLADVAMLCKPEPEAPPPPEPPRLF